MDDFEFEIEEEDNQTGRKDIELNDQQKKRIKKTLKQMEANLVQPQNVEARTFTGAGFASKPSKIIYKDFEVGHSMSLTIDIINVSLGFNSFKLLPLDDEII